MSASRSLDPNTGAIPRGWRKYSKEKIFQEPGPWGIRGTSTVQTAYLQASRRSCEQTKHKEQGFAWVSRRSGHLEGARTNWNILRCVWRAGVDDSRFGEGGLWWRGTGSERCRSDGEQTGDRQGRGAAGVSRGESAQRREGRFTDCSNGNVGRFFWLQAGGDEDGIERRAGKDCGVLQEGAGKIRHGFELFGRVAEVKHQEQDGSLEPDRMRR